MASYERNVFRQALGHKKKVGVALGGGSARGAANIGVLKALIENGISIDYVAGTSSGAIVGALFASGMNFSKMLIEAGNVSWTKVIRLKFNGLWPTIYGGGIEKYISTHIKQRNIEDLIIPFSAVATDYKTGGKVVLNRGNLAKIVHASAAVPGLFFPVELEGKLLMDGALVDNVPADVVKEMGADYVIAIDVAPDVTLSGGPKSIRQGIERAIDIIARDQCKNLHQYADLVVNPVVENCSHMDMHQTARFIKAGEQAILNVLDDIKQEINAVL